MRKSGIRHGTSHNLSTTQQAQQDKRRKAKSLGMAAAAGLAMAGTQRAHAAYTTLYWDPNGASVSATPTGQWDASTTAAWNTSASGGALSKYNANSGNLTGGSATNAIFGTTGSGTSPYTVTISGSVNAHLVQTNTGTSNLTLSGGTIAFNDASDFTNGFVAAAGSTISLSAVTISKGTTTSGFLYAGTGTGNANGLTGTVFLGTGSGASGATAQAFTNLAVRSGSLDVTGLTGFATDLLDIESGGTFETNGTFSRTVGVAAANLEFFNNNGAALSSNNSGGFAAKGGTLAVNLNGGSGAVLTFGAANFIDTGFSLVFGSETSDNTVTLNNGLNFANATQSIDVKTNTSSSNVSGGNLGNVAVITGVISNGALNKTDTGTLILTGTNTYTGGTNVQNGTLEIGGAGSLSSAGAMTLGNLTNSGILQLGTTAAVNQTVTGLTTSGSGSTNAVVGGFTSVSTLTINNSGADSYAAVLGGAGTNQNNLALVKTGAGTLTLSGANTYTGGTTVGNAAGTGTLLLNLASNPSGVLASTGALTMGGGTLNIQGNSTGTSSQTVASLASTANTGVSNIVLNPNGGSGTTLTITNPTLGAAANSSINFNISAGGTIALGGSPTQGAIGGGDTVTDATGFGLASINGSNDIVRLATPTNALPASGATSTVDYGVSSTLGNLNLTQTASQTANSVTVDTSGGVGSLTLGTTTLGLTTNSIFIGGSNGASTGTNTYQINSTTGSLGTAGNLLNLVNNNGSAAVTLNTSIAGGTGGLSLSGTGYTIVGSTSALGAGSAPLSVGAVSNLDLGATSPTVGILTGAGTILNGTAGLSKFTIGGGNATGSNFTGVIEDNAGSGGTISLIKTGTGTATIGGTVANTYSGGTTVSGGTLIANSSANIVALPGNLAIGTSTVTGGTVTLNAANQLSTNAIISFTGANNTVAGFAGDAILNLNGNETVRGLTTAASGQYPVLERTVSGTSTLKVNTLAGDNFVFNGYLVGTSAAGGNIALDVEGPGSFTATRTTANNNNDITGGITIGAGATFGFTDNGSAAGNGFGNMSATGSIADSGNFILATAENNQERFGKAITGTGTVTINASGGANSFISIESGGNNFSGGLIIAAGTADDQNHVNNAFGTGAVTFSASSSALNQNDASNTTIGGLSSLGTNGLIFSNGGTVKTSTVSIQGSGTRSYGGLIKNNNGTGSNLIGLTLTASNTSTQILTGASSSYTGGTIVNGGTLVATSGTATGNSSIGASTGALTLGASGTFNYAPTAATPTALSVGTLTLANGSKIGAGIGSTTTNGSIAATTVSATGATVAVNIEGDINATPATGTYTLLSTAGASLPGTYNLGTIYNASNFTVGSIATNTQTVTVGITGATALTSEYWVGGLSGAPAVWSASNGSTASNWASNSSGTAATSLTPGPAATINFSASSASNQGAMTLGANMSIAGFVSDDSNAVSLADGYSLTVGSGGITMGDTNASAGAVTLGAPIILGAAQTWTNSSSNLLKVSGASVFNGANTLIVAGTGNTTISAALGGGAGGLTMTGTGTLTLNGVNTYTGATAIQNGTVILGTLSGTTTGSINSASSVTLGSGANSGVLQLGDASNPVFQTLTGSTAALTISGSGTSNAVVGGNATSSTLTINNSGADTYAGSLGGAGTNQNELALTKTGAGLLKLTGVSTYIGGTTISAGTVLGSTHSLEGNIVNNGTSITFDQTSAAAGAISSGAYSGNMSGTGAVIVTNAGTTNFSGVNSYTGGTTVSASAILGGTTASLQGNITDSSSLVFDQTLPSSAISSGSYVGVISGTGTLTKNNAGTVILTGANTYQGTTFLNGGTLQVASTEVAGTSGALGKAGSISFGGGTLQYSAADTRDFSARFSNAASQAYSIDTNSQAITFASALTSSGGTLTKLGAGSLTLGGANTYSGGTTVSAGSLIGTTTSLQGAITNNAAVSFNQSTTGTYAGAISSSGAVSLDGSGTVVFTGTNTYTGATAVNNGSFVVNGSVSSTTGGVTVGSTVASRTPTLSGTGSIGGTVTIQGTAQDSGAGVLSSGNLNQGLTSFGGLTLDGGSNVAFTTVPTVGSATGAFAVTSGLTLASSGTSAVSGLNGLGSGTYELFSFGSLTAAEAVGTNLNAEFSGDAQAGKTYNIFQADASGIASASGTYVDLSISNIGGVTPAVAYFQGATDANWDTADPSTGAGNFTTDAAGTTNTNALPGVISTGVATDVHFYAQNATTANVATSSLHNTPFTINSLTIDGTTLSESGNVSIAPGGSGGVLTILAAANSTDTSGPSSTVVGHTAGDGINIESGAGNVSISAPIILGASQTFTNNGSNGATFSGAISDGGSNYALTLAGTGTTYFSAANTYGGGTTISAGSLVLSGSATLGTSGTALADNGTLDLGATSQTVSALTGSGTILNGGGSPSTLTAASGSFSGVIEDNAGSGSTVALNKTTAGTLILSGTNTYSGGTTIAATGTIQLSSGGVIGGGALADSGTLDLNGSSQGVGALSGSGSITDTAASTTPTLTAGNGGGSSTFGGIIGNGSGTVAFTKAGAGTLTLTGANTYSGGTTISTGTLQLGTGGTIGSTSGALSDAGTLDVNGVTTNVGALTGGGTILNSKAATNITLTAGTGNATGNFTGTIENNSGTGGTLALATTGSGTLTLSGTNTYTGGTTIAGGSTVSIAALADSGTSNIGDSGTLTLNNGTLLYTGGSTTTSRAVTVSSSGGTLDVSTGGTLATFSGTISNSGALAINGAGTTVLTHASNIGGTVTVSNGTLVLDATGTAKNGPDVIAGALVVNSGATVQIDGGGTAAAPIWQIYRSSNVTLNGTMDLNGSAEAMNVLSGTGTVTNTSASLGTLDVSHGGGSHTVAVGVLIKDGTGQVGLNINNETILTNANTYTGPTNVVYGVGYAGVASVAGVSGAFGNNSALILGSGSYDPTTNGPSGGISLTDPLNSTSYNTQVGSLSSPAGATTIGGVGLGTATLTIGGSSINTTYAGNITGGTGGALTMAATGTQTLTGSNTYTGGTTISGGTLQFAGTGAAPSGGNIANTAGLQFSSPTGSISYTAGNITDASTPTGTTTIDATSSVTASNFTQATLANAGSMTINSTGSVATVSGAGTTNIGGSGSLTSTTFAQGTLANAGTFNLNGTGTATTVSGAGTTNVAAAASLTATGFAQATLMNAGSTTINGTGTITTVSDASTPTGTLTIGSSGAVTTGAITQASLVNNGTAQINGAGLIGSATTGITGTGALTIGNASVPTNNTVQIAANSLTSTQTALTINSGSTLDITNNKMLINYGSGTSPLTTIGGYVNSGAITSSTVTTDGTGTYAVGYADDTETSNVPTGNVKVMFTLAGDANLDGTVDIADVAALQNNFNNSGDWAQGDFNHDGQVNIADVAALQNNFNQSVGGAASPSSIKGTQMRSSSSKSKGPKSGTVLAASMAATGLAVGGTVTPAASTSVVTYILSLNDNGSHVYQAGHYAVYASDNTSDGNGGMALYGVKVDGATTVINFSPKGNYDDGTGNSTDDEIGFTAFRADAHTGSGATSTDLVSGQQDTSSYPNGVILAYGMGQTAGNLANFEASGSTGPDGGTTQPIYGAPLMLMKGTWGGGSLVFDTAAKSGTDSANVFTSSSASSTRAALLSFSTVTLSSGGHSIISLTAAGTTPTNYGSQITAGSGNNKGTFTPSGNNKLNVTGNNGSYTLAQVTGINSGTGDATDYVESTGFNPTNDQELYALDVKDANGQATSAELTTLKNEINGGTFGTSGIVASTTPTSAAFPSEYNLFLTISGAGLPTGESAPTDSYLGFDLSTANDSGLPAGLTVAEVAVVPEPTSLGLLAIGGAGLLAGRRRKRKDLAN